MVVFQLSQMYFPDDRFPHTSNMQKTFLSWQSKYIKQVTLFHVYITFVVWDLPRIDIYGFSAFCAYFFKKYPGYFVFPLRISGSEVESLFSQFKHNDGGKLDLCNYITIKCAHLVKQSAAQHHSSTGDHDQTLSYMELPLQKKKYESTQHITQQSESNK